MKLNIIKRSLEQLLSTTLTEQELQDTLKALQEVCVAAERATDPDIYKDEVYIVSASNLSDLMINGLYETYAARRKIHGEDFPVSYFQHDARKVFGFEDFTNEQLAIGYEIISDLWADNEAAGNHNENGLLHNNITPDVKLTISSAECNCLLEAIEAANEQIRNGKIVYVKDGYMPETAQLEHAKVTADIARSLAEMIDAEKTATIVFAP